jgi:ABC-2 type transport system permease protein
VYRRLIGARIRGDLQYRASFVMFTLGQFATGFVDFLAVLVLFHQVDALAGWDVWEVAFLYGLSGCAFNVCDIFVSQVELLPARLREGTFDRFLLRPLSSLLQLTAEEFALRRIGRLLQAVIVLAVALRHVDIHWTPAHALFLVTTVGSGTVIFSSVWIVGAASAFWTTETGEIANSFTYGGNFLTQYPMDIYGRFLRRTLGLVVPLAFVSYLPAAALLGKPSIFDLPSFVAYLAPVAAAVAAWVAAAVWRAGVRHHKSTGS